MTTTVQVTVAGHKVKVTQQALIEDGADSETTLEVQGQTATFYAHGSQSLIIEELPEASITPQATANTGGSIRDITDEEQKPYGGVTRGSEAHVDRSGEFS